jgi:hypothetical protein
MEDLKERLIRLGSEKPSLRGDLYPVISHLDKMSSDELINKIFDKLHVQIPDLERIEIDRKNKDYESFTGIVNGKEFKVEFEFLSDKIKVSLSERETPLSMRGIQMEEVYDLDNPNLARSISLDISGKLRD